jgi:hypothetical protein
MKKRFFLKIARIVPPLVVSCSGMALAGVANAAVDIGSISVGLDDVYQAIAGIGVGYVLVQLGIKTYGWFRRSL